IIGLDEVEKKIIDEAIANYTSSLPIHRRISDEKINQYLTEAFKKYNIESEFEFGVYDHNILTKVHSEGFDDKSSALYSVAIFSNPPRHLSTNYELKVNLLSKQKLIYASVFELSLLSLAFTLIIIVTFYLSLSQWIKQRKISQIKSDFINNMTHEFKTPIATINLALDSLNNPKIKNDPSRIEAYHNMIREENRRMHAQVENVLRISKLEKRELNLEKEALHLHEVLANAINHVSLIIEQHNGRIETSFLATADTFLGNKSHFTNVLINILDNAIKYSENAPEIVIKTELLKNKIHLSIADNGIGMSKAAQKRIFEKFYREHTGDIHNVKGHGLGLAYAKRILDDHNCSIFVESEKGVGSTFIIQIPQIT
ncbi:MAG: HAMP domain-containing sensor histidine kinase, partial [Flavobacteriaceae bacterium]|nr:HAMP domain-containing sensor histidine kinase [Flavobacteriaceae bacterium]